jgi:hypothetical protein
MERSNLPIYNQGTASEAELHCLAYITVDEDQVKNLRDTLRPKRAFVEKMD